MSPIEYSHAVRWSVRSATELARAVRDREVGAVDLTRYFIDRIEAHDDVINAVVVRDFERALSDAAAADDAQRRGEDLGPLHGVPITVKESFDVQGLPTTWGLKPFADTVAETDATVVSRLRHAGAIVLGKTNVPVMLSDYQTENPLYGKTHNPWNLERTPGGSSGGSAAAIAAGLTGLEFGSDLGGSIRFPCHACGVYGHKPTWGIVPMFGQAPPNAQPRSEVALDLGVVGPLARSAEDLRVALGIVAGPDRLSPGWTLQLPPPRRRQIRGLRVALWPDDPVSPVASEIADRIRSVGASLEKTGATVCDQARPDFDSAHARRTYVALAQSIIGASAPQPLYEQFQAKASKLSGDDTSRRADATRGLVLNHRQWVSHDRARHRMREAWARFFEDWDVLLCPAMAVPAPPHDDRPAPKRTINVDGEEQAAFQQVFWASLASAAYLPATVAPVGRSHEGLPLGVQIIGAAFDDHATIEVARLLGDLIGGFTPPPRFRDGESGPLSSARR